MSEFNQLLKMALMERQAQNPTPDGQSLYCQWAGKIVPICAGDEATGKQLGIGGWGGNADQTIVIILEDLVPGYQTAADLVGKIPALKQTLVYQGKVYRIDKATIPPGLAFLVLDLIDPTKGA